MHSIMETCLLYNHCIQQSGTFHVEIKAINNIVKKIINTAVIIGAVIVVPFEGSVVAIAVGRLAPSVLEFVAIVEEFLMWVCVG